MNRGNLIQAEFKSIDWLEPYPIEQFAPDPSEPFSIQLTLLIGPKDLPGKELFYVDVVNPLYLAQELETSGPRVLLRQILVREFSVPVIERLVRDFCAKCAGETWKEVALMLMQLGCWEFEGIATP